MNLAPPPFLPSLASPTPLPPLLPFVPEPTSAQPSAETECPAGNRQATHTQSRSSCNQHQQVCPSKPQHEASQDSHSLQRNERRLVLHDGIRPPPRHLGNPSIPQVSHHRPPSQKKAPQVDSPINTPHQNRRIRPRNRIQKHPKPPPPPKRPHLLIHTLPRPHPPSHTQVVIHRHRPKQQQHHNLQRDPSDNGAVTMIQHGKIVIPRRSSQRAADGLDQKARDVERDEDEGVEVGADAREGRVEGEAEVLEGEVDGDAEQGRREDDGADLGFEGVFVPGVGGEGDAGGVACGGVLGAVGCSRG